jgi:hypothetical protein
MQFPEEVEAEVDTLAGAAAAWKAAVGEGAAQSWLGVLRCSPPAGREDNQARRAMLAWRVKVALEPEERRDVLAPWPLPVLAALGGMALRYRWSGLGALGASAMRAAATPMARAAGVTVVEVEAEAEADPVPQPLLVRLEVATEPAGRRVWVDSAR